MSRWKPNKQTTLQLCGNGRVNQPEGWGEGENVTASLLFRQEDVLYHSHFEEIMDMPWN
jgi:hypothetical protein